MKIIQTPKITLSFLLVLTFTIAQQSIFASDLRTSNVGISKIAALPNTSLRINRASIQHENAATGAATSQRTLAPSTVRSMPLPGIHVAPSLHVPASSHSVLGQTQHKTQTVPAIASNCRVVHDKRNNTIIYLRRTTFVMPKKVNIIPPQDKYESSGIGCYYQHDTTGYGGEIGETNACQEINVQDVAGDGVIVSSSDATLCHVVIANVTGTGLIIKGSNNVLHDVVLVNCKIPLRLEGSNNTVICTILNIANTDVNALTMPPPAQNAEGNVDASTTRVDGQILRR